MQAFIFFILFTVTISFLEVFRGKKYRGTLGSQFQVISDEDKFRHNLPTDMAEDFNTQFETYVKEEDLKQQILMKNPMPDNLDQVKKLDNFVRDVLKDKSRALCQSYGC